MENYRKSRHTVGDLKYHIGVKRLLLEKLGTYLLSKNLSTMLENSVKSAYQEMKDDRKQPCPYLSG
jgi:hypothetical protein